MTNLLTEAFKKAQNLPEDIQDELAKQLIEDIENEFQWQQTLSQAQNSILDKLAHQFLLITGTSSMLPYPVFVRHFMN